MKKYCSRCKSEDESQLIVYHRKKSGRIYHYCNDCNADKARKYRMTPKGAESILRLSYQS